MRLPLLVAALCAAVSLGCSSDAPDAPDQPAASSFAAGTCQAAAPDVLAIGRDAHRLGQGPEVDKGVQATLTDAQTRLRELAVAAEPAYKAALDELVVAVGLVRLQAQVGKYQPAQGEHLVRRYEAVVAACT